MGVEPTNAWLGTKCLTVWLTPHRATCSDAPMPDRCRWPAPFREVEEFPWQLLSSLELHCLIQSPSSFGDFGARGLGGVWLA
jgi:hypothetical protein